MANPEVDNYVPINTSPGLTFSALRAVNVTRCKKWHPPDSTPWNAADWSNATCGEAGEMANVIKKIRRHETGAVNQGDPSLEELRKMAAAEIADVVIYADLLADYLGVNLGEAIREKFNKTSVKFGFPERL
jgi:NTP pyrophosphatase (non-canonical NTP hydrolase)